MSDAEDDLLDAATLECVISNRSPLVRITDPGAVFSLAGAAILAVSRNDHANAERADRTILTPGDVALLQTPERRHQDLLENFALLPLNNRALELDRQRVDWHPPVVSLAAVIPAAGQILTLPVALVVGVAALAIMGLIGQNA